MTFLPVIVMNLILLVITILLLVAEKLLVSYGDCKITVSKGDEKEEFVWGGINSSFSRPVRSEDETINYIPTQYLSEFFKNNGYDGIIYKSALTEKGYNIVLFNPKNARLKGARVFQIKSIKQTFEECDNSYTCKN